MRAGRHVNAFARDSFDDDRTMLARERARAAEGFLDFRSFDGVKPQHDPMTVRRTARSKARNTYVPLLDFLPTTSRPLSKWAITHLGDRRSSHQHKILLGVLATVRREGIDVRPFRPDNGILRAGPVEYRHPGARGQAGAHGIRVGSMLLDVPDVPGDRVGAARRLGLRSGTLSPHIVENLADVAALKDQLVEATRTTRDER